MALTDSVNAGVSKRIRQACASCRQRKIKCSGEHPICFHCRRNNHSCVYEPYSATVGKSITNLPAPEPLSSSDRDNAALLRRLSTIESRLAELSEQAFRRPSACALPDAGVLEQHVPSHANSDPDALGLPSLQFNSSREQFSLPPSPVMRSVVDTFFTHVHNQPYSYFQESSFRLRLDSNALPRCLILAVLASAIRFSNHEYFAGKTQEATDAYARESWLAVLSDHLTVEENMNVSVVQTVNMLAIVDYTAGRVSAGWLKIGLAARISQDLQLMKEAGEGFSPTEQEERRRAFWSTYLVDKLISCGRSRPLAILDDDCNVLLPCDEQTFQNGEWKKSPTLDQLRSWETKVTESPSPFALVILMASILGSCTSYFHRKCSKVQIPPWDPRSEFSTISSSLLLLESYSNTGINSIAETIKSAENSGKALDTRQLGHLVFAHALFHLCHCLLGHPFLAHLHLKPFNAKTPASFTSRMLQAGCDHARQLLDFLQEAGELGCLIESSFYPYCITVAAGILSLHSRFQQEKEEVNQSTHSERYFNRSLDALEKLGNLWTHASNMIIRLRDFHAQSHQFAHLCDPSSLADELDPTSQEALWSLIDYGTVGSDPRIKSSSPARFMSGIFSPTSWGIGTAGLMATSPGLGGSITGLFSDTTPTMPLDDVDNLFNYSSGSQQFV